ncbi:MAG: SDR family oxidoreductase [Bdellovibrionota bacterium]
MNRIALITGANKGIGFETARQLGRKSFSVVITARDEGRGQAAQNQLAGEGIDAHLIVMDPLRTESIQQAVSTVQAKFGVLDVLINNCGTLVKSDNAAPTKVPMQAFHETYALNVFALHEITCAFWPLLNKSKAARLVNVSSMLGSLTAHADGSLDGIKLIAYDSSKAAVNMMTVHYAFEWRNTPHRANTIHPGSVKTDLNPGGELTLEIGAKTSVDLATIPDNGPNGQFFHLGEELPW